MIRPLACLLALILLSGCGLPAAVVIPLVAGAAGAGTAVAVFGSNVRNEAYCADTDIRAANAGKDPFAVPCVAQPAKAVGQ